MDRQTDESGNTLRTLWEQQARWNGQEVALVTGDTRLTYGQIADRARRLGSALHQLGLRSQDRVSVLSMNSATYLEIFAANEWAGFITATVNFRLAAPEVAYIVGDASPLVFMFEAEYTCLVDSLRGKLPSVKTYVCLDGAAPDWAMGYEVLVASGDPTGAPLQAPGPDDTASLVYTSGTTGRPKGCMLGHGAQTVLTQHLTEQMQMSPATRTLLTMPLYHVGAKGLQQAQHRAGGRVYLHRVFDVEAILREVQAEKITHLHFAPVMLQALIEHPDVRRYDLSSLRCILYSAAPMSLPTLQKGLELLGPVFMQMWGQTECGGTVLPQTDHRITDDARLARRLVSIGHAFPGIAVRLVDDDDHEVAPGQAGELTLRSRSMMQGYWNNSAATIEAKRGGWLHTGDVCTQDEDGYLYLVDRKKDVIISGGENIYSREVEQALATHPAVQESAVIGMAHDKWGEAVCAVVLVRPGHNVTPQALVAHCRQRIASYKRPRFIALVDELPRLPSGKVSKVDLRQRFGRGKGLEELA